MLGRRLLLFAAVLMLTAAIASTLAPDDLRRDRDAEPGAGTGTETATAPPTTPQARPGDPPPTRTVEAALPPSAGEPRVVRLRVGDLLRLVVRSPGPDSASIEGLDRIEPVDATTPARFEFFAERSGRFPVRLRLREEVVGALAIAPRREGA